MIGVSTETAIRLLGKLAPGVSANEHNRHRGPLSFQNRIRDSAALIPRRIGSIARSFRFFACEDVPT